MKINWYVINLDRDSGRLKSVEEESQSLGISINRVPAIDAHYLDEKEILFVSKGVNAAWLSHMKTLEIFLDSDAEFAIITEDDFHVKDVKALKKLLDQESTFRFDFLQLGFLLPGVDTYLRFVLMNFQQLAFRFLAKLVNIREFRAFGLRNRMRVREALMTPKGIVNFDCLPGAHCYLASRKFAENVINLNSPQILSIDDFYSALSRMRSFKMARLSRSIVIQLPFKPWSGDRFKSIS